MNSWTGWKVLIVAVLALVVGFVVGGGPYAAAQRGGVNTTPDTSDLQLRAIRAAPPTRAQLYAAALHVCRKNNRTSAALVERLDQQMPEWPWVE